MSNRRSRGGGGPDVIVSKALSSTLRHNAEKEGLKLRPDGYAKVSDLLAMPKFQRLNLDFETLKRLVRDSDKQRFSLVTVEEAEKARKEESADLTTTMTTLTTTTTTTSTTTTTAGGDTIQKLDSLTLEDTISNPPPAPHSSTPTSSDPTDYLIRANQGHSIKLTSESLSLTLLTLETLPPKCIHGTFYPSWEAILTSGGLKPMGRNHIHFAPGLPGEGQVISGMRKDAEVLIYVDMEKAIRGSEGRIKFWKSANEVILTEGDAERDGLLGLEYVEKVVDNKNQLGTLWEWGRLVKELPERLRDRPLPMGKGRGRGGGRGGGRGKWRGERGSGGGGRGDRRGPVSGVNDAGDI